MRKKYTYILAQLIIVLTFVGCTEPFAIKNQTYEDVLVVEAIITNELKHQEVRLTRATQLTDNTEIYEKNALVWIETGNKDTYHFSENEQGEYLSDVEFKAVSDITYKLFITTSDGKQYESKEEYLAPETEIENLYGEKATKDGELGVQVFVDTNEADNEISFFRYEFEETYKVVAPYNVTENIELTDINIGPQACNFTIVITECEEEKTVGYITEPPSTDIQLSNNEHANSGLKTPIIFIKGSSSKIRDRYSILVKLFSQTQESYEFYKKLRDLGSIQNLLLNNQPGYINGNMHEVEKEKVMGYFEVTSVSEKRVYFDYADFDLTVPDYRYNCANVLDLDARGNDLSPSCDPDQLQIYNLLVINIPPWEFYKIKYIPEVDDEGGIIFVPYYSFVSPKCGNVSLFSSTVKPDFWED